MKSRETLIISGGLLAQQVTVFATGVVIARYLGAAGFGTLGILKSLSGVLVIVMPLGLDLALLKHASFYREEPGELQTTSRALRALVAACNLLLLCALLAGLGALLQRLYKDIPDFAELCAITMAGLVFAADIQISGALYRVFDRVVLYFAIVNYTQPVLRIILSAAVLLAGGGVISITIVNSLVFLISFLMIAGADRGRTAPPVRMKLAMLIGKLRLILSESLWMAVSLLVYQLIRLVDILILAALTTPQITGAYTAISSVAQLIQIYPNAVSQTLGPQIALAYKNQDHAAINDALAGYLRKASIMGGYLLGGVAVFGTDLGLVFGHGFDFPWLLPVLLGTGWFISATLAPLGYVLSMTGRHRLEVVILTAGAVLLVVCLLLLVPPLQATGAALSVAITFAAVNAARSATVIRIIGCNPILAWHALPPTLFVAAAFLCRQAGLALHGQTLPSLILQCGAYTAIAGALYAGLLATGDERAVILGRLRRRTGSPVMRLAIVAPHFPEYALRYAAAMAPHGEVFVCVDTAQLAAEYAGRAIVFPENAMLMTLPFKTPGDFLKLAAALRRFKPDILHFQEAAGPRRALFNAALARIFRRSASIIVTVHDPTAHAGRDEADARRTAGIARHLRNLADRIIVHGEFCAAQMRELDPASAPRLVVSDHGLILEPDSLAPPPDETPLRLYFFGRMEAYKGVSVLLEAAEALHAEGFPFTLSIAGRGPELDRLEARFARLPEITVFNGFVPPTRIMADIQSAGCVVLPYLSATQSGVLAAAYAGRRYVLASDTGGLPDVVVHGRNGLLVPPGNAAALAGAIRALGGDPALRARLSRGARETAEGRLGWERIAREVRQAVLF